MFLVRSIRRRLVTGFTVALMLLLVIAGAAIWGLMQHQTAVDRLNHLVHHSPNRDGLLGTVSEIPGPLYANINLLKQEAVIALRIELRARISEAQQEANRFWRQSEDSQHMGSHRDASATRRTILAGTMSKVNVDLNKLAGQAQSIEFFKTTGFEEREKKLNEVRTEVNGTIASIIRRLKRLPKETYVAASLEKEGLQSKLLLRRVWILVGIALVSYAITIYCGFRWISNPLRTIAQGASRIANGDTNYRLNRVTIWEDEFADLTDNFNRMTERFLESERDLAAKVEERSRQLLRTERLASVGCLSAGVAHEINNPLSAISMAAESIQMRLIDHLDPDHEDTAEAMDRLSMIQRESKRCGQITRRLLDFSRNEKQEKLSNDLTRVVGEVLAMIRPMSKYKERSIKFDRTEPLMVEINASQIKQVILNLIVNGLQASANDDGTVEVCLLEQTDWVVIQVTDDGEGMTSDNLEQLFEPFFSTKQAGEGTGLGLSITNRIVEDHHGTIEPFSAGPGQGSTFSVRLPRRQPQQKAA